MTQTVGQRGGCRRTSWLAAVAGALGIAAGAAHAGEDSVPGQAPRCEVAVVNPVSGFAECVKPRGVPVDPPPKRSRPTPEECAKHQDLDADACRESPPPQMPPGTQGQ